MVLSGLLCTATKDCTVLKMGTKMLTAEECWAQVAEYAQLAGWRSRT
jgi:hypothetical protein